MEKSTFQSTINAFKNAGVTKYMLSVDGENTTRNLNNETSIIIEKGDHVVIFSMTDNVGSLNKDAVYDVAVIPYTNITGIRAIGMSFEQGIAVASELGIDGEDAYKDLIKNNKPRQNNNPGVGGQLKMYTKEVEEPVLDGEGNPVLDDEGNPVTVKKEVPTIPDRMSHYVVNG